MTEPRYEEEDGILACLDCGAIVVDREVHTRFHSILSGHAWALAVLETSHIAAHVHDRYDASRGSDASSGGQGG